MRVSRLVVEIPEADPLVIFVGLDDFPNPFVMPRGKLRFIQQVIAHLVVALMLRMLSPAVIAPIEVLLAELQGLPELIFGRHTVVSKGNHARNSILPCGRNVALKPRHEAVVILIPDDEFGNDPDGIESRVRSELQFALGRDHPLLKSQRLPLIDAVGAIASHEIAPAKPGMAVIPVPRALPAPLSLHAMFPPCRIFPDYPLTLPSTMPVTK